MIMVGDFLVTGSVVNKKPPGGHQLLAPQGQEEKIMSFTDWIAQRAKIEVIGKRLERIESIVNGIEGAAAAVTVSAAIVRLEANKISAALQGERINEELMMRLTDASEQLIGMVKVMREFREISQDLKDANAGVDRLLEKIGEK
jgi:hypothetical protein